MASIMKRGSAYSVRYTYTDHRGKKHEGWESFKTKQEAAELAVIQSYLPKPLTEEELTALIDATIAEVGATSPREMGKVISAIMATHKGRVDGKALSAAVKARLTA